MTNKEAFEALSSKLSETDIIPVASNFVFESTDSKTELDKYYRYLMEDTHYMESKRKAAKASYYCGEVWTLSDEYGNFVAVAHVVAHKDRAWKGSRWVWKGEVMYLHN